MKNLSLIFRSLLLVLLLPLAPPILAGDRSIVVDEEISYLLEFIKKSTCTFQRNGTSFTAADAAEHINKKYLYFSKKGKIKTAEDFIYYAASKSTISGNAYMVRCEDGTLRESAEWLTAALAEMRAK